MSVETQNYTINLSSSFSPLDARVLTGNIVEDGGDLTLVILEAEATQPRRPFLATMAWRERPNTVEKRDMMMSVNVMAEGKKVKQP